MSALALDSLVGLINNNQDEKTKEPGTVSGRCDTCSNRASYEAKKNTLRLVFCAHHVRKNSASLLERGFSIYPEDYNLN